jgi:UDP-sulfoquinovose synthase
MRILILGSNGYLGNALIHYLDKKHEVYGCDNGLRDRLAPESLTPVKPHPQTKNIDICNYGKLRDYILEIRPEAIVHLAEIPSAPFSMKSPKDSAFTQQNNIVGSLNVLWAIKEVDPTIHLVKLGTAGEYPDWLYPPNIQVPEGARIYVGRDGAKWKIPTPRYGGSFYHMSKLHDSNNCDYANRIWGLKITDINQAPVYGHVDGTRFDYDEEFGTVVNRFVAQALAGYPLTVYGEGRQTRGYIHIKNSLEAIELVLKNPPEDFRIIHQLTETKSINDIAELVQKHTGCQIDHIENPRAENPSNEFDFEMQWLSDNGLKPIYMKQAIAQFINEIRPYQKKINKRLFEPKIKWK